MATKLQAYKVKHNWPREIIKHCISALIVASAIAAAIFLSMLRTPPESKESTALVQQAVVRPAESYSGELTMEVSGTVVPHREIRVASEVSGKVIKRYPVCENGSFVNKGDLLLEIDREAYQLELQTLQADLVQSEKRIEENQAQIKGEERNIQLAKADLELQRNELDRNNRLGSALSKTESEQSKRAFNAAQTQLTTRENNLTTLKAGSERLKAALELSRRQIEKAELNLRRTTIVAPSDGVVVRALVQEGDFVAAGTQVVTFEDTEKAEVLVNLTPAELKWIRENAPPNADLVENSSRSVYRIPKTSVKIFDPANPGFVWQGVLTRFDGIGRDDVTKTIPCRIHVELPVVESQNEKLALVRGMYVKCMMAIHVSSDQPDLFQIPEIALHPDGRIWVAREKSQESQSSSSVADMISPVKVDVINRLASKDSGIHESLAVVRAEAGKMKVGDRVIISPLSNPVVGMPILIESESKQVSSDSGTNEEAVTPPPSEKGN